MVIQGDPRVPGTAAIGRLRRVSVARGGQVASLPFPALTPAWALSVFHSWLHLHIHAYVCVCAACVPRAWLTSTCHSLNCHPLRRCSSARRAASYQKQAALTGGPLPRPTGRGLVQYLSSIECWARLVLASFGTAACTVLSSLRRTQRSAIHSCPPRPPTAAAPAPKQGRHAARRRAAVVWPCCQGTWPHRRRSGLRLVSGLCLVSGPQQLPLRALRLSTSPAPTSFCGVENAFHANTTQTHRRHAVGGTHAPTGSQRRNLRPRSL
jgi:hypothetical protein